MDEISGRFADEILTVQPWQNIITINHRTARGSEPTPGLAFRSAVAGIVKLKVGWIIRPLLPPGMRPGDPVGMAIARRDLERGYRKIRISSEVPPGERRRVTARNAGR